MPYFKVVGTGKETNRKRTKRYMAKDENAAKVMAEADGTIVENVEYEKPGSATDKQIKYAKNLGLSFPNDIDINEISNLLDKKINDDRDSPEWLYNHILNLFPEERGLSITKYIGLQGILGLLINRYTNEQNYIGLIKILIYSIISGHKKYNWSVPFNELGNEALVENIAEKLSENQKVINSIKRYTVIDFVILGDSAKEEDFINSSNLKRTNAYTITKASLKSNKLIDEKGIDITQNRKNISTGSSKTVYSKKNSSNNQGCFGSILFFISIIITILFNVP